MNLTNEDWKYKIINASPTRLVIVTYEIVLDRINKAKNYLEDENEVLFRQNVNNAREFITELLAALETKEQVGKDLADLYIYSNKLLTEAYFSKKEKPLEEAENIILRLKDGLEKEVDDSVHNSPNPIEVSETYKNTKLSRPLRYY